MNTLQLFHSTDADSSDPVSLFYLRTLEGTLAFASYVSYDPEGGWDDAHEAYRDVLSEFPAIVPGEQEQIDKLLLQTRRAAGRRAGWRYRSRHRFLPIEAAKDVQDPSPLPSRYLETHMAARRAQALFLNLSPEDETLIRLFYCEEKTQGEIAEVLKVTQATVSRRLTKVLNICREQAAALGFDE